MKHTSPPKPTEAELGILRVIWAQGPSTVRQIQETLEQARPTGYTTVLKLLQIMWDKGLVTREESSRTHVYRARYSQVRTQRQLLTDLLDRAFGGSASQLVMQALATKRATRAEMDEISKLLAQHRGRGRDDRT
jgi:predicted transcriptional regulator